MRIIHLLNHCNHGHGNAHVAVDLASIQSKNGHAVVYASAGGDYEDLLRSYGVGLERIVQNSPAGAPKALGQLLRLCRRFKPDLIHAHMMSGAVIGYAASIPARVPLVTTVHNSFDPHSVLMRLGRRVVAVSEAENRSLRAQGYKPQQLEVVLNGPNEGPRENYMPQAPSVQVERPAITTVCGLHRRKGVADLLAAFAQAHRHAPQWGLNIVGDGPDKAELEQLARDLGLAGKARFLGSVPQPKTILERSDIFVLASYADPCSLAVGEARGAGCAIVATAVGGTPELLEAGRAGRLVSPGKPDEIAAELRRLMSDEGELVSWKARAKKGSEFLTVDRVVRDYDAVYYRLLAGEPPLSLGGEWRAAAGD